MTETRTRATGLEPGVVVLNGVSYQVARVDRGGRPGPSLSWWREDGELVTAEWDDWSEGMGETRRFDPSSKRYAYSEEMDCSSEGMIRLSPSKYSAAASDVYADFDVFFFEAEPTYATVAGQFSYIYAIRAGAVFKFFVESNNSVTFLYEQSFDGTGAAAGRPTRFEGLWYVPVGTGILYQGLATIASHMLRKVFTYDDGAAGWTDNTTEAKSALGTPFNLVNNGAIGDIVYVSVNAPDNSATWKFNAINFILPTVGTVGTVAWEYWNGAWVALTVTDGTSNFTQGGTVSFTAPSDWATTAVNGNTAYWIRARVTGAYTIAPTCYQIQSWDTWTAADAGLFALGFTNVQDGGTARIAKAYSTNLVALAATAPLTAGSWASGFEVGDSSTSIRDILEMALGLVVARPENAYLFDTTGASYPIFNLTGQVDLRATLISRPTASTVIYAHKTGLHALQGETTYMGMGVESLKGNQPIPNYVNEPINGAYIGGDMLGTWLYVSYYNIESSVERSWILAGDLKPSLRAVKWHTVGYTTPSTNDPASGPFIDSQNRLWYWDGISAYYRKIGKDGSPDAGRDNLGRGTASTTHRILLGQVPFWRRNGEPAWDRLKTLRACKVVANGVGSTAPLQVRLVRDEVEGTSVQTVGATITSNGYSERALTAGTNDTCRLARYVLDIITTAGYDPTTSDPQILRFEATAVLQQVRFIIDCNETVARGLVGDAKTIRDNLETLRSGVAITVTDPDDASLTLTITQVNDLSTSEGAGGTPSWLLEIIGEIN